MLRCRFPFLTQPRQIPPIIFGALNCRPVVGKRVAIALSLACRLATYRAVFCLVSVPHPLETSTSMSFPPYVLQHTKRTGANFLPSLSLVLLRRRLHDRQFSPAWPR